MHQAAFVPAALPWRTRAPPRAPLTMGRRSEKIKGRRDKQTRARTKIFARIGKMITIAAKAGGPDATTNKALADALEAASAASFPKETADKAVARATSTDQADFKESSFEAYGFGGAAFYIDVLTDNSNRAAADIRTVINKAGLKIASPGSVAFNFERMGVIMIDAASVSDPDELLLSAIDAGAEECELDEEDDSDDSMYRILTAVSSLNATRVALAAAGYAIASAQLEMIPQTTVDVSEADMERNMRGFDRLEDLDDVDAVFINAKCAAQ